MLFLKFTRDPKEPSAQLYERSAANSPEFSRQNKGLMRFTPKCVDRQLTLPCYILLLLVAFTASGCGRGVQTAAAQSAPISVPPVDSDSDSADSKTKSSVSNEEATTFGNDLATAIRTKDSKKAGQLIAWREILKRAVAPFKVDKKTKDQLIQGAMTTVPQVTDNLSDSVAKGGSYQLVHVKRRSGYPFALFRFLDANGSFNYNLLRIRKVKGVVIADQFFTASTGEEMSDTLRNALAPGVQSLSWVGRLTGAQKRFFEDVEAQKNMVTAITAGKKQEALKIYDQMRPKLKKAKLSMLYRIMATSVEDEAAYATAVDEYLEAFPDDAAVGLITLDAGAIRKDADLLIKSHQSLNKWTGGDPYLDLIIGANLVAIDRNDLAVKLTKSIDPATVGIASAHDFKLAVGLAVKDHAEVLKQLRVLRDEFGLQFSDLSKAEGFEDFAKSPQHEQWKND